MSLHLVRSTRPAYGPRERVVVVGGGAAGWAAAAELRRLGFAGEVTVVCGEPVPPYDRTACSKDLLVGRRLPSDITLDLSGCRDVRWKWGVRAEWLDPHARRLGLSNGEALAYDGLVVATGTRPAAPSDWPVGKSGVRLLHGMADAWSLRESLVSARRVAVVGGGLTGCEMASAAIGMAREVVVVNSQPQLMARAVGEHVGALLTEAHRSAGVGLALGCRVAAVEWRPDGWRLELTSDSGGGALKADVVVVTAGERPDVEWLAYTPADISDGVLCDEALRVVGLDGVVAAGSIARWPNRRHGDGARRVGQWISAVEQGQGAARTLLVGADAPPVAPLTRFWSDQNGLRVQVCGQLDPTAQVMVTELRPRRRDTARAGVMASYIERGRLVGVAAVNAPRAFATACRTLLAEPLTAATLPVPEPVPLRPDRHLHAVRTAAAE